MAFTLSDLGAGSGFVYVTENDGTTIIANIINDVDAWQNIQKYASASAPLTGATNIVEPTFGNRFFGNTTGIAGSLAGAVEITRFITSRAANASRFRVSVTIVGGVATTNRITNDMVIWIDTEGAAGTDDLDTLTLTDAVDNDVVTLVGLDAARVTTLKHGTGNIFLSNNTDFSTGDKSVEIILRFFSGSGWFEVSRGAVQPTVAQQRAVSVPTSVNGVNLTTLTAGGGTIDLEAGVDKGTQVYDGSATLVGSWVIQPKAVPTTPYLDGDEIWVVYNSTLTVGANSVTIFGITLSTQQALAGNVVVRAIYKLSNTTWYSDLFVSNPQSTTTFADAAARAAAVPAFAGQIGTQLDTDIAYLANGTAAGNWIPIDPLPASGGDTFVLQKTIAGVYSFVPI